MKTWKILAITSSTIAAALVISIPLAIHLNSKNKKNANDDESKELNNVYSILNGKKGSELTISLPSNSHGDILSAINKKVIIDHIKALSGSKTKDITFDISMTNKDEDEIIKRETKGIDIQIKSKLIEKKISQKFFVKRLWTKLENTEKVHEVMVKLNNFKNKKLEFDNSIKGNIKANKDLILEKIKTIIGPALANDKTISINTFASNDDFVIDPNSKSITIQISKGISGNKITKDFDGYEVFRKMIDDEIALKANVEKVNEVFQFLSQVDSSKNTITIDVKNSTNSNKIEDNLARIRMGLIKFIAKENHALYKKYLEKNIVEIEVKGSGIIDNDWGGSVFDIFLSAGKGARKAHQSTEELKEDKKFFKVKTKEKIFVI